MIATILAAALIAAPQARPPAGRPTEGGGGGAESVRIGDVVEVAPPSRRPVYVAADFATYARVQELLRADDREGVNQIVAEGRAFALEHGAKVKVIAMSGHATNRAKYGIAEYGMEVRIQDGPRKGQSVFLNPLPPDSPFDRTPPPPTRPAPKPKPAPIGEAGRAQARLQVGLNLEKDGRTAAAISAYEGVVRDFGATPAADTARERLKALKR